ncbi:MAG: methyl-accepting chemotaxis protein [Chthoniobacter sp.]|nr:methyl-accepting chemotaxis protein [Chthoniobacter sp.]
MKLSTKLHAISLILVAVAIAIGVIGIVGIRKTNAGLETVYNDRVVPLKQLKAIADDYAVAIIDAANKCNAGIFTAEETLKGLNEASTRIKENWKAYMSTYLTPEEAKLAKEADALYLPADAAVERLRAFLTGKTGSLKGTLVDFDGPLYQHIDPISGKITELVDLQLRVAKEEYTAAHARFEAVLWLSIVTLTLGVVIGGGLGWKVIGSTTQVLHSVSSRLAEGAAQTTVAAREVSGASQSLAEGASEQAASLEETSASLEEISSMTRRNSENATNAASLGRQSRESAAAGLERIGELSSTINSIKSAVGEMQTAVSEMQTSSQQVSKIIKTIDEIAFQTNLLALNAAVEAARAGEAGMGFAVVADEVRALAQRSAQAAKDTSDKIEAAVRRSELGAAASTKVAKSLTEVEVTAQSIQQVFTGIVGQIKSLDEVIAEIAAACKEQSQGVGEVNMAVSQMDKVTQSNAAAAEENAASANEMSGQARTLQDVVARLEAVVSGATLGNSSFQQPVPSQSSANAKPRATNGSKPFGASPFFPKTNPQAIAPTPSSMNFDIPMPEPVEAGSPTGSFKDF